MKMNRPIIPESSSKTRVSHQLPHGILKLLGGMEQRNGHRLCDNVDDNDDDDDDACKTASYLEARDGVAYSVKYHVQKAPY